MQQLTAPLCLVWPYHMDRIVVLFLAFGLAQCWSFSRRQKIQEGVIDQ